MSCSIYFSAHLRRVDLDRILTDVPSIAHWSELFPSLCMCYLSFIVSCRVDLLRQRLQLGRLLRPTVAFQMHLALTLITKSKLCINAPCQRNVALVNKLYMSKSHGGRQ